LYEFRYDFLEIVVLIGIRFPDAYDVGISYMKCTGHNNL